ncbi:unnamed protein product [Kluyveromyces dobzhanskii CBS 2104]|uniref:WGS project CCBQ000000000 data, contig 00015 n=1 Tax=Kluyveromyces dobzhanskii CBS 2104 TaxID=1427455 RepID=A0A0A8L971_9SACH|nr:unnamed protein product [Kluyveromyces dobzhanskii CBS 2104]
MYENDPYGWYLEENSKTEWLDDISQETIDSEIYNRSLEPEKLPTLPPIIDSVDENLKRDRSQETDRSASTGKAYFNACTEVPCDSNGSKRQRT